MDNVNKVYRSAIVLFFIPIVLLLLFINLISTSYVTWSEVVFFLKDNAVVNVAVMLIVSAIVVVLLKLLPIKALREKLEESRKLYRVIKLVMLALLGVLSLVWVFSTRFTPFGDAAWLHEAASDYENGVYTAFENGFYNYIDLYPFQTRTLLIYVFIDKLFGGCNLMVYQVINCIALVLGLESLSKLGSYMGGDRFAELLTILLGILWVPGILYTSFVYGNLPGVALALLASRLWFDFMKRGKLYSALLSGLAIAISVAFKSTFLIFFVAMVIYGAFKNVKFSALMKWAGIVIAGIILVPVLLLPQKIAAEKSGEPLDQGMATLSWIEMGLEETVAGPGWYTDDSKRDYAGVDWNNEAHTELSRQNILTRLDEFKADPHLAATFFTRKVASMWNEPTTEAFWVLRSNEAGKTDGLCSLADYMVYVKAVRILDVMLMLILFGVLLYLIFEPGKRAEALFLPMVFVGLFLFHFIWEAKAQYAFFGWFAMLPVAVMGYVRTADRLGKKKDGTVEKATRQFVLFKVIMMGVAVAAILLMYVKDVPASVTADNYEYAEYLNENF